MTAGARLFLTFAGAGGGRADPTLFADPDVDVTSFQAVDLPDLGWHLSASRTPQDLLDYLCGEVERLAPHIPLRLVGVSLGGHLAHAVALRFQARDRDIGGLCLVDSFFGGPPVPGRVRLRREFLRALGEGRLGPWLFQHAVRRGLKPWARLRRAAWQRHARVGVVPWDLRKGSLAEYELSMALLLSLTAPLTSSAAVPTRPLQAPALLLRTADNVAQDLLWKSRCPQLQIAQFPGDHHTMAGTAAASVIREQFQRLTQDWR